MLCERKNIAASIKDTDSVVNSLETGLGMLIHFIFIAMYLLVWGVNIVQVRRSAGWQGLRHAGCSILSTHVVRHNGLREASLNVMHTWATQTAQRLQLARVHCASHRVLLGAVAGFHDILCYCFGAHLCIRRFCQRRL